MLLKGYQKVAHRGLHAAGKGVPENSLPAFRAAAEAGYAIERGVHRAADGTLVVFHDHDLRRMTGAPVSYTHRDVYKRQAHPVPRGRPVHRAVREGP